ncbi:MAG: YncE family protein [Fibrobacteres bacterium]|nr:YncE family protein [Fibrobacterota bacterium]
MGIRFRLFSQSMPLLVLFLLPEPAPALGILNSLPTGSHPVAIAVNPVTNRAYVANSGSNTVSVIDNASSTVIATLNVGTGPCAIVVDPLGNLVYVANKGSNSVSLIDGATQAVTSIAVGQGPSAIVLNGTTREAFVANTASNSVSQISGGIVTRTISVGTKPVALAVNASMNRIYAANNGSGNVSVINGSSGTTTSVAAGAAPVAIGVNTATNRIYVANSSGRSLTVINGTDGSVAQTVPLDSAPTALAVDQVTNKIYVVGNPFILNVIDGADYSKLTNFAPSRPSGIAINPETNVIFIVNEQGNKLLAYDGARINTAVNAVTEIRNPRGAVYKAIAINTVTNQVFAANDSAGEVDIVDGSGYWEYSGVPLPPRSFHPRLNPITGKLYIPSNQAPGGITVVDAGTGRIEETLATPDIPYDVGINPVTNKLYVGYERTNKVHIIDLATKAMKEIALPMAVPETPWSPAFTVNPVANKIYLKLENLWLIDGVTDSVTRVGYDSPILNPTTDKIYLSSSGPYPEVGIMDGISHKLLKQNAAQGFGVTLNPVTNEVYINNSTTDLNGKGWVDLMDGFTDKVDPIPGLSNLSRGYLVSLTPNIATNKLSKARSPGPATRSSIPSTTACTGPMGATSIRHGTGRSWKRASGSISIPWRIMRPSSPVPFSRDPPRIDPREATPGSQGSSTRCIPPKGSGPRRTFREEPEWTRSPGR